MRFGLSAGQASTRAMQLAIIAAIIVVAVYSYIYLQGPFSTFANDLTLQLLTVFSALFSAISLTLVWSRYEASDLPRPVWGRMAVALWLWVMAELTWSYEYMTQDSVQVGLPDFFWIIAYLFMAHALLGQYRILSQAPTRQWLSGMVIGMLFTIALTLVSFLFLKPIAESASDVETLIGAFYPAGDLALAVVALRLARDFRGGAFGRPWWGLIAFTVSDLLYAWLDLSGTYAWSVEQGNPLSALSDITYIAAYLVMGLGAFSLWLFLKYGLRYERKTR